MGLEIWNDALSRVIALLLQVIGIAGCIGLVLHAAHLIVSGAIGGSGRAVAELVTHVIGVAVAIGLALSAPRLVAALIGALVAGSLFG